jgi:hypothetical protein
MTRGPQLLLGGPARVLSIRGIRGIRGKGRGRGSGRRPWMLAWKVPVEGAGGKYPRACRKRPGRSLAAEIPKWLPDLPFEES